MAILCVEGNVQPSEFLYVLDYDDALTLAERVAKRRAETEQRMNEFIGTVAEALVKANGNTAEAVAHLGKVLAKAFSK